MSDIDALIDTLVSDAQIRTGAPKEWLRARDMIARPAVARSAEKALRWTKQEDAFYLAHVGRLSLDDIGAALGRSANAVKIHATRHGLPMPSKVPGYVSANQVANILGIDAHSITAWVDCGIMPGERIPGERVIRRVSLIQLKMWLVRPTSWIYIKVHRIKNPSIRRLVELAQEKWGDEWMTTVQAAEYHQCKTTDIQRQIKLGRLPGVQAQMRGGRHYAQRWAYWYVRRSDVENLVVPKRRGAPGVARSDWNPRADAFLLRCIDEGKSFRDIGMLMNWSWQRVRYRLAVLKNNEVNDENKDAA